MKLGLGSGFALDPHLVVGSITLPALPCIAIRGTGIRVRGRGLLPTNSHSIFYSRVRQIAIRVRVRARGTGIRVSDIRGMDRATFGSQKGFLVC